MPSDARHAERQPRQGLAEEEREDGSRVSAASGGTHRVAVRYAWPSRDMTVTCGSLFIQLFSSFQAVPGADYSRKLLYKYPSLLS